MFEAILINGQTRHCKYLSPLTCIPGGVVNKIGKNSYIFLVVGGREILIALMQQYCTALWNDLTHGPMTVNATK